MVTPDAINNHTPPPAPPPAAPPAHTTRREVVGKHRPRLFGLSGFIRCPEIPAIDSHDSGLRHLTASQPPKTYGQHQSDYGRKTFQTLEYRFPILQWSLTKRRTQSWYGMSFGGLMPLLSLTLWHSLPDCLQWISVPDDGLHINYHMWGKNDFRFY